MFLNINQTFWSLQRDDKVTETYSKSKILNFLEGAIVKIHLMAEVVVFFYTLTSQTFTVKMFQIRYLMQQLLANTRTLKIFTYTVYIVLQTLPLK